MAVSQALLRYELELQTSPFGDKWRGGVSVISGLDEPRPEQLDNSSSAAAANLLSTTPVGLSVLQSPAEPRSNILCARLN